MLRRVALCLLLAALAVAPAHGQTVQLRIIATCGTPPGTLTAGGISEGFIDTTGKLCDSGSGGGGGGTSSNFAAAFPAAGTAIGVKNGANMVNLAADASSNLLVNLATALPTGANTIGAVTQGTSPWVDNVTQFGGTNISTGTGAGGAGIPRVTISNDSSLAANQSVNVNQFGGSAVATGTGAGGAGIPRVTISNDAAAYSIAGSAASSLVLKASAGKMYSVSAECTAACWLMVFNATSAPGDGATTAGTASGNLQDCIPINANQAGAISYPNERPENFSVGITAVVSSTTCATKTASTVAFIKGFAE